jgi:hypothetical protein
MQFIRREGPVSTLNDWTLSFENLLAWGVVTLGYLASSITLSVIDLLCHVLQDLSRPVAILW